MVIMVNIVFTVFSTLYVIKNTKPSDPPPRDTPARVTADGSLNNKSDIDNKDNNNNDNGCVKDRVKILDQHGSDSEREDATNNSSENKINNNNNNNNNNMEAINEESNKDSDPKEEAVDDHSETNTNDTNDEHVAKNSTKDINSNNSVNHSLKSDPRQMSDKLSPPAHNSPHVTEPDEQHSELDDDEQDQDPEYEEDVHEIMVVSSSSSQIRTNKTSLLVEEINNEIVELQLTIQRLESEDSTPDKVLKIVQLKAYVTNLKTKLVKGEVIITKKKNIGIFLLVRI